MVSFFPTSVFFVSSVVATILEIRMVCTNRYSHLRPSPSEFGACQMSTETTDNDRSEFRRLLDFKIFGSVLVFACIIYILIVSIITSYISISYHRYQSTNMSGNAFYLARRHSVKNEHDLLRKWTAT